MSGSFDSNGDIVWEFPNFSRPAPEKIVIMGIESKNASAEEQLNKSFKLDEIRWIEGYTQQNSQSMRARVLERHAKYNGRGNGSQR